MSEQSTEAVEVDAVVANTDSAEPTSPEMYGGHGLMYNYDLHIKTEQSVRAYFELPLVKSFFGELSDSDGQVEMLDLGSGIGVESAVINNSFKNIQVTSLELSTYGARKGRQEFGTNQVQANALDLPFEDHSFGAIHSKDMFVHIRNKEGFFSEISRVLKEEGLLLIVTSGTVYESFGQIGWSLDEVEKIAAQFGLMLEQSDIAKPSTDDWYGTNPERFQLLFRKKPTT